MLFLHGLLTSNFLSVRVTSSECIEVCMVKECFLPTTGMMVVLVFCRRSSHLLTLKNFLGALLEVRQLLIFRLCFQLVPWSVEFATYDGPRHRLVQILNVAGARFWCCIFRLKLLDEAARLMLPLPAGSAPLLGRCLASAV